jgi:hypothetical protein
MKETSWELQGGLKFRVTTPTTIDEYSALAGVLRMDENSTGVAVLDDAIENVMYRGAFAEIRRALAIKLAELNPDIPRETKNKPGAKPDTSGTIEQVFDESEGKYISRVAATKGVAVTTFQSILDEIMAVNSALPDDSNDKIKFDPSQRERKGPSSTEPGKLDLETAKALLAQGQKKLRVSLARITDITGVPVELVDTSDPEHEAKNIRAVAFAVKAYRANPLAGLKA